MGPLLLVDKCAIQSYSYDEIVAINKHYSLVICPILLIEIQANLLKEGDPEIIRRKVSYLAKKANGMGVFTIERHEKLFAASLLGNPIGLTPQIPMSGGKEVIAPDGSKGVILEEMPEEAILRRWSQEEFTQEDIEKGKEYLDDLEAYGLDDSRKKYAAQYPENTRFKTIEELYQFADNLVENCEHAWPLIESFMKSFRCNIEFQKKIKTRWEQERKPNFVKFAPYASYSFKLGMVYWAGVTAGLMSTSKHAKTIVDHQYFYYLPFVHGLCSGDNFHEKIAPYFLRHDQFFLWAPDLKADINKIMMCIEKMTPEEKRYYTINYGYYPPPIPDSLTVKLWREHMVPWELGKGNRALDQTTEEQKKTLEYLNSLIKESIPIKK